MLLELNARPGLTIQMANGCGLEPRLARIRGETTQRVPATRVTFSRGAFGAGQARRLLAVEEQATVT